MLLRRFIMMAMALAVSTNAAADEVAVEHLTIEKMLFLSDSYSNAAERGEVWVKLNANINVINPKCAADWYGTSGYLVATFPLDKFANQTISGLLAAKASGKKIRAGVESSRKNGRGICSLSYYEVEE